MAEALDTLITLGWWALGWLIVLGVIGSILILSALATGAYTCRLAWRAAARPSWARGRLRARIHAAHRVRRPSGRTEPRTYEEAA
ncbi:hypothetical protein ACH4UY_04790 [Streptomyces longwoodensis]|uniref:hypothetical protein n=1 Tax=Streptomyces longwoodensis TaxID=68231 RepID=UPI0037949E89